ncbi:flagellar brake protein [Chitinilyticum piscinae]|uniref:Flagellar brake protein n=1 Tax=Chitinilyticum piscinae TaxID=2866724 RepID=A0A8J7FJJ3_9NEIS|nr:flagellar brake protein [Chitinilyticum piscinae]MBE9610368.1 flagellar brake protein [Chitinilyticum piscinae]
MADDDLLPLRKSDLQVGVALPYPVYDRQRHLLIAAGDVIQNEKQVEVLLKLGVFRNPQWSGLRSSPPAGGARVHRDTDEQQEVATAKAAPARATAKTLNQTKLLPGMVVHVQSAGDALKPKAAVKLIGWLEKTAVLVSATGANGAVLPFRDDEVLQFKAIAGKDIISFFAPVMKMSYTPYPLLHLAWPEQVQIHQLRKSLRVNTRLIASVSNARRGDAPSASARMINLSAGGAMLESRDLLGEKGDELLLGLRIPAAGESHTLSVRALIRNIHEAEVSHEGQGYGLEFVELPMAERLILEHYIYQTLLEN